MQEVKVLSDYLNYCNTHESKLFNVVLFSKYLSNVRVKSMWLLVPCLFFSVVLAPSLKASKDEYSTQSHQYNWFVSGVYLSGHVPGGIIFFAWCLILVTFTWVIVNSDIDTLFPGSSQLKSNLPFNNYFKPDTATDSKLILQLRTVFEESIFYNYAFYFVVICTILFVIASWNVLYIYMVIYSDLPVTYLGRFIITIVILLHYYVLIPLAIVYIGKLLPLSRLQLSLTKSFLYIFVFLIAPIMAEIFSDGSCFSALFNNPDTFQISYLQEKCLYMDADAAVKCVGYDIIEQVVSFEESLIYNNECNYVIFRNYIPVLIITYIVMFLITPFGYYYISKLNVESISEKLLLILPGIIWPDKISSFKFDIFTSEYVISSLFLHLSVLITFGMVSPLLAVVVCFYNITELVMWEVILNKCISFYDSDKTSSNPEPSNFNAIDLNCYATWQILKVFVGMILSISTVFQWLYIWDVSTDQVSVFESIWAPFLLIIGLLICKKMIDKHTNIDILKNIQLNVKYFNNVPSPDKVVENSHSIELKSTSLEDSRCHNPMNNL